LQLQYDETLSNFAFKFNLRRYTPATPAAPVGRNFVGNEVGRCKLKPNPRVETAWFQLSA
jgi:hypothetical protein